VTDASLADTPDAGYIEQLRIRLGRGERVHDRFGGIAELHIDRQLPFLCVYRQPADVDDEGTSALLHGQASYLKAPAGGAWNPYMIAMVTAVAEAQVAAFGSYFTIELWAGEVDGTAGKRAPAPAFRLHAPRDIPSEFLTCAVNALQGVTLRKKAARVGTVFGDRPAPPGLEPLVAADRHLASACMTLGIEVLPVYRDRESGKLLPFALNAVRRGMAHALKSIFYRFSHSYARYYPDHFQELGPKAITDEVREIDRRLAQISENFDLLLHVTPVNSKEAWEEFRASRFERTPRFHYRPRSIDPALAKRSLHGIPLERSEDPVFIDLFSSKRDELDRQLTLLGDRGTHRFMYGSLQLFGPVGEGLLDTAKTLISRTGEATSGDDSETLGADALAREARDEIGYYRKSDPTLGARVEVRDDITGILVSHGNFLIGSDAGVSKRRLSATLNHEIGTHALTYHNGRKQPLQQLYAGMAGYEELQEGLAVLAEYLSGGLSLSRLQLLAGRVVAVHSIVQGADFVEAFRLLQHECGFRAFTAYTLTMRVFRGGGYTKDIVYLRGLMGLLDLLAGDGDLDLLFYGKIAMEHLHLLDELRWRRVLAPVALTPRYLDEETPRRRLAALRGDATLEHLLENLA
jgi:uncharacterized protein (TIGR02421 family)